MSSMEFNIIVRKKDGVLDYVYYDQATKKYGFTCSTERSYKAARSVLKKVIERRLPKGDYHIGTLRITHQVLL